MKKVLLLLVALFGLTLLGGCPGPDNENDEVLAFIRLHLNETVVPMRPDGRVAADVPGFDQKFGTVSLIAFNVNTQKSYVFETTGDWVRQILVPEGTYDLFMEASDNLPNIFTGVVEFTATAQGVSIVSGETIDMIPAIDQALILFSKGTLDGPPTIEVSGNGAELYTPELMYDDTNFYYMYVYGTWGYLCTYSVSGAQGSITRVFDIGKIYVYDISGSGISIGALFDEVITNN